MISALLSSSRHVRRHAFDRLPSGDESAYAARELVAFDPDAAVRARAAWFLAAGPRAIAEPALALALEDEMPLVRHAATRALAAVAPTRTSLGRIARMALEDPVWWVRRAAVVSVVRVASEGPIADETSWIPVLREALEDPFWRVRAAAVRALVHVKAGLDAVAPATTPRAAGALSYIARRLGVAAPATALELDVPNALVARLDPDPAIVTARVERGDAVTTAFLVECLGDPHEALRVTARKRLARSHDLRALELALLWLDEPRIPHAAKTVVELLDGLEADEVTAILDTAFERGGPGAVCWAASYVGLTRDASRMASLLVRARAAQPIVRCAVIAALGEVGGDEALRAILAARGDADPRVVRTAVQALAEYADPHGSILAQAALAETTSDDPATRRMLAAAAAERGDVGALRTMSSDADPHVRTTAVAARAACDDLDAASRAACRADPDPWIRAAALDEASAEHVLAGDPQPWVRRAAFRILAAAGARAAGVLAARCDDPWLRTRAAALLDPHNADHLVALLRLAADSSVAVRAAAADALERSDVDDALEALLRSDRLRGNDDAAAEDDAKARIAALAHRSRRFEDADFARLEALRATETMPAVRAWIDELVSAVGPAASLRAATPPHAPRAATAVAADSARRPLGATGLDVSPLVVSGAGMLPSGAYADAMHAGCNLFFWEPRYHTLGRMLARERGAGVLCGSYEATERAIVSDVERYLRRLRRDTLDVFLLFWARSPARVDAPLFDWLHRLKEQGKIRAFGFSTHDRDLACDAIAARRWDVVMTRHSAVHPGAEERFLPLAHATRTGVFAFSSLSYGRALGPAITAPEAYRYTLSQPGVSACLSAPRTTSELEENLAVLRAPPLPLERQVELRAHGKIVHEESRAFGRGVRRHPIGLADARTDGDLAKWLDHEEALDPRFA